MKFITCFFSIVKWKSLRSLFSFDIDKINLFYFNGNGK